MPDREPTLDALDLYAPLDGAGARWRTRALAAEARVREAESERDALAEAFDGEFPLGPDEWIEVRNAWKRRAEAAEARVTALEQERDVLAENARYWMSEAQAAWKRERATGPSQKPEGATDE